ncbi:MAG: hypothetical protein ACOC58_00010 [Chloroflexota bacterium]
MDRQRIKSHLEHLNGLDDELRGELAHALDSPSASRMVVQLVIDARSHLSQLIDDLLEVERRTGDGTLTAQSEGHSAWGQDETGECSVPPVP